MSSKAFRMRLPATSANLGSGFDTAAVALSFFLNVEAEPAAEFGITATGIDSHLCSRLENNLLISIYSRLLRESGRAVQPVHIKMHNEIPFGMGCGSSAAGRLAAIAMASHFGELNWTEDQILEEACALEGHPDNAAACWLGGFVTAANEGRAVQAVRVDAQQEWRAIIVQPSESLATSSARAVLPPSYLTADVIVNLQAVSMLALAFAQGRGELLRTAMQDRIHQPYRAQICPLLPPLLELSGRGEILGTALSGAGPAVLVIVNSEKGIGPASEAIMESLNGMPTPELRVCTFENRGARESLTGTRCDE